MFSSTSFAEWKKVVESVNGDTFYVDFERIRKHGGYVYFWDLMDLLKPMHESGMLSLKNYHQGDCKLFRYKLLSSIQYRQPMGGGTGHSISFKNPEWKYPHPNSVDEHVLKKVCSR